MSDCDHKWAFQHVVYWNGRVRPGTDARDRMYGDAFFCEKCLARRITNEREMGNTYHQPIQGTYPR